MTGWLGALVIAMGRIWGWNDDELPVELFLPLLMIIVGDWEGLVYRISSPSVDELVFSFDRIYGYPEFFLGRVFSSAPVVIVLAKAFYFALMMPVVAVYLALNDSKLRRKLCISVALMGLFGAIFYHFCPAAGPIYVFHEYPRLPVLSSPEVRLLPHLVLNATPSVHLAMALLVLLYSRYCSRLCQVFGWVCLALTVLTILGLGEHYVIDLVLGVPFAAAIDGLPDRSRRRKAYGCFLLVLVWEFALCHGLALHIPAPVALLLSCMTVAAPFAPRLQTSESGLAAVAEVE
jgi:hypothetical protein